MHLKAKLNVNYAFMLIHDVFVSWEVTASGGCGYKCHVAMLLLIIGFYVSLFFFNVLLKRYVRACKIKKTYQLYKMSVSY